MNVRPEVLSFMRHQVINGLRKLDPSCSELFGRMYPQGVDKMTFEQLNTALDQIERSMLKPELRAPVLSTCKLTFTDAADRIREHNAIHQRKESQAVFITQALDMAAQALDDIADGKYLHVPPFSAGDHVYLIHYDGDKCMKTVIRRDVEYIAILEDELVGYTFDDVVLRTRDVGFTVFMSHKEAEARIAKLLNKEDLSHE